MQVQIISQHKNEVLIIYLLIFYFINIIKVIKTR
jgi:hypothetical protein